MDARFLKRAALILLVGCLPASPLLAQQEQVRTVPFEGPEIFTYVLQSAKIKPITSFAEAAQSPGQTVIIVLGHPRILDTWRDENKNLLEFVRNGGNLFIATDYKAPLPAGYAVNGMRLAKPEGAYRNEPECPGLPFAESAGIQGKKFVFPPAAEHPLFGSLQRELAPNRPSYLTSMPPVPGLPLQPLLEIKGAEDAETQIRLVGRYVYMAASPGNAPPRGRVLLVAGHGMFMNGMMLQSDNGNYEFTRNVVRWLHEGADGKSSRRALFIYDSRIVQTFQTNLSPPPPPIPMPTVAMINRLLRGLEEERFFHKVLEGLLGRHLVTVVMVLLGLITLGFLLYGAKKLRGGRVQLETAAPSMVRAAPALEPNASIEARQRALLSKGNFGEQSHQLALEWFRAEFDVTPDRWRAGVQAGFRAEGSFWERWRLQRKADRALRLARSAGSTRLSRHQFFLLVEALQELSQARRAGRLALLVEGKNVRQT